MAAGFVIYGYNGIAAQAFYLFGLLQIDHIAKHQNTFFMGFFNYLFGITQGSDDEVTTQFAANCQLIGVFGI